MMAHRQLWQHDLENAKFSELVRNFPSLSTSKQQQQKKQSASLVDDQRNGGKSMWKVVEKFFVEMQ